MLVWSNADARVCHADDQLHTLRRVGVHHPDDADFQDDLAVLGELDGVVHEIEHDLPQPHGVDQHFDPGRPVRRGRRAASACAGADRDMLQCVGEPGAKVDGRR